MTGWTEASIRERVEALKPWFHNMDLRGVRTAPEHFLFDYPAVKWARFAHTVPDDLRGRRVLDIGCNAGFYSMEMARRGASVLGIDHDERYLAQARFAAEVEGLDIAFRLLSVYDVGLLGEKFDIVLCLGVLYHLRHPLLALDLIHEHVAGDMLLFQTLQRGALVEMPVADDYDFHEKAMFDDPRWPKLHFIENRYSGDPTNWWLPNGAGSAAMLRSGRVCHRGAAGNRRSSSAAVWRAPLARSIPGLDYDRSRYDLERAQQQIALGLRQRSELDDFRRDDAVGGRGNRGGAARPSPACWAVFRRSTRCSSRKCRPPWMRWMRWRCMAFRSDWNHWMIDEWPQKLRENTGRDR